MGNMCSDSSELVKGQGATPETSSKAIELLATDIDGKSKEEGTAGNRGLCRQIAHVSCIVQDLGHDALDGDVLTICDLCDPDFVLAEHLLLALEHFFQEVERAPTRRRQMELCCKREDNE